MKEKTINYEKFFNIHEFKLGISNFNINCFKILIYFKIK